MKLKDKVHVQEHKRVAEVKLSARMAFLKEKGKDEAVSEKDTMVRQIKATIRKANRQLAIIGSKEKMVENKVKEKEAKAAAKEDEAQPSDKKVKKAKNEAPKKEKKAKDKKQA